MILVEIQSAEFLSTVPGMSDEFFEDQTEASALKARIVSKYFWAWAKIMLKKAKQRRIGYLDLFAGPGVYGDQNKSTPILILERAVHEEQIGLALVATFNEANAEHAKTLRTAVDQLPGIKLLKTKPVVAEQVVGPRIVPWLRSVNSLPSLIFIDPFGYKGVTKRLIDECLRQWGSDLILFFNYNRINAAITNLAMKTHVDLLFGTERANRLRSLVPGMDPAAREKLVIEEFAAVAKGDANAHVLPFRFSSSVNAKTSHYLFFVSRHPLGLKIAKDIMAAESQTDAHGFPTFEFDPKPPPAQGELPLLLEPSPLEMLEEDLRLEFAGKTLTVAEVFKRHQGKTRFTERH